MTLPIRQCVVCRTRRGKPELLRMVRDDRDHVIFDPAQKMQGRGCYLCANSGCLTSARQSNTRETVLGGRIRQEVYLELAEHIAHAPEKQIDALLGFAVKSRKAVLGWTAVEQAARRGTLKVALMDSSIGPSTKKRVEALGNNKGVPVRVKITGASIARIAGKSNCRCLGLVDDAFARTFLGLLKNA